MKHALVVAVAVVYAATSLAEGGYPPEALAAGTLLIWWAVIVGLAVGAWPRARVPRSAIAAGLCITGLWLLTALSLSWASDDGQAFVEVVRVAGYVGLFALVILTSPAGNPRGWLIGLAIGIVVVAAISLGSRFEPALPGSDSQIGDFIPTARGRLSYPIGYWNGLAACMALGTVLLAWLGARGETRAGRAFAIGALPPVLLTIYLTSSRGGIVAAAVGLAALLALGPARVRLLGGLVLGGAGGAALVGLAGLRDPLVDNPETSAAKLAGDEILLATLIIAAGVGLARYLVDSGLERLTVSRTVTRVALAVLGLLALATIAVADPAARFEQFKAEPPPERFGEATVSGHLASGTGSGRYQFWTAALDAFRADPVTGLGAGGYESWWNQNATITRSVRDAHSLFFEAIGELGLPGLLLIVSFLGLGATYGWRRRAGGSPGGAVEVAVALLATGLVAAAADWTWEIPAAFGPVVIAVALLTGPAALRGVGGSLGSGPRADGEGSDERGDTERDRRSFGWGVATLLAGWIAIWAAGLLLLTEVKLDDSRTAVDRGDLVAGAHDAGDASTLQPWAAEPKLQLALVAERAGDLPAARRAIGEAIDRAPDDWTLRVVAGRIEAKAGDREAARALAARAYALSPRAPGLGGERKRYLDLVLSGGSGEESP